ncbi:TPA: ankyrin repeat domain-containing protein [Legionella pneumophila]|nr:ankyrin repeat domain-containing protein [Legionella pneumophila]HAU1224836.1 ankyrin repeat domain-containing protein [Legionella pneumophila]
MSFSKINKTLESNSILKKEIDNQEVLGLTGSSGGEEPPIIPDEMLFALLNRVGVNLVQQACIDGNLDLLEGMECEEFEYVDSHGTTPLMLAIEHDHKAIAYYLLQNRMINLNLHKKDNAGRSALSMAKEKGWDDIVDLIGNTMKNNWRNKRELYYAAINGYLDSVTELLTKIDEPGFDTKEFYINTYPLFGNIFHAVCCGGNLEIVKLLMEHGAEINSRSYNRERHSFYYATTPILVACRYGHAHLVEYLLTQDAVQYDIIELFHIAVEYGHYAVMDLLLRKIRAENIALDLNRGLEFHASWYGTPLDKACKSGQVDIVDRLIAEGIDMKEEENISAIITAIWKADNPDYPAVDILERLLAECDRQGVCIPLTAPNIAIIACNRNRVDILDRLIIRGVDFNLGNRHGDYPLITAAAQGHTAIVDRLLSLSVDVNQRDSEGKTALFQAASHNNLETVKLLVNNGADINIPDNNGVTPLMFVASTCYTEVVKYLLKAGADTSLKDNKGRLALDCSKPYTFWGQENLALIRDADIQQNSYKSSNSSTQSSNNPYTLWSSNRTSLTEEEGVKSETITEEKTLTFQSK